MENFQPRWILKYIAYALAIPVNDSVTLLQGTQVLSAGISFMASGKKHGKAVYGYWLHYVPWNLLKNLLLAHLLEVTPFCRH
jgi:hypothetical protein